MLSGGRVATATGAKPNVIVVQKAQPKRGTPGTPTSISVVTKGHGGMQSPFEKVRKWICVRSYYFKSVTFEESKRDRL